MINRQTHQVELECHHTLLFSTPVPKRGEMLWCIRCRKERMVIAAPEQIRIRCRNCRLSRMFGQGKVTAECAAASHRRRHPDHIVDIKDGLAVIATYGETQQRQQMALPYGSDDPPPF
jgi:hypothetical protein